MNSDDVNSIQWTSEKSRIAFWLWAEEVEKWTIVCAIHGRSSKKAQNMFQKCENLYSEYQQSLIETE